MFLTATVDAAGVVSLMPFIAIISQPDLVSNNNYLIILYNIFLKIGGGDLKGFLIFLGGLCFLLLSISSGLKILTMYLQVRFAYNGERDIGQRILSRFLFQSYSEYLSQQSSELGQTVLSEVNEFVAQLLLPLLNLIAQTLVVILILGVLIAVNFQITMIVVIVLATIYLILYSFVRALLFRVGQVRALSDKSRYRVTFEAFNAFKVIKLTQNEDGYISRFNRAATKYATSQAAASSIAVIPRYVIELIVFGSLLLVLLYVIRFSDNLMNVIPTVSVYVFAGYRLLPALQQIYVAITQITYSKGISARINAQLIRSAEVQVASTGNLIEKPIFNKYISLENVCLKYPQSHFEAVKNINLKININTSVGFVGPTGSGKSTTMDIILGLLEPSSGYLKVDDRIIDKKLLSNWRNIIGHVPQDIHLIDGTISENIAFGIKSDSINTTRLIEVSKQVKLHDFIMKQTQHGYETLVGDRGVRLSGGQIQRIAIARCLYNSPDILILDEATSALDNITEKFIVESMRRLGRNITIIMVAHRLSSVRNCDEIFVFDGGRIIDNGTFESLSKSCSVFKTMLNDGDNQPFK
ncbi:MAG: ABC transporter ATP-binding protein [Legionellales bacterium]|nr:ABC transporter ATP-binding protein [Legionellales bacterium]OUX66208.1 MAG: hypothetical protein CBE41_00440 [Gammaproteobacteria bacterium TMED281]